MKIPYFIKKLYYLVQDLIEFVIHALPNSTFGNSMRAQLLNNKGARIGKGVQLLRGCKIVGYHLIEMGPGSGVTEQCYISLGPGDGRLKIGANSCIGPQTFIRNTNHKFDDPTKHFLKQGHDSLDIIVGDNVWVGGRSILLGGTKIGDHSIVAAGSVISFEIPPWSVVAGNPARVVKKRNKAIEAPAIEDSLQKNDLSQMRDLK